MYLKGFIEKIRRAFLGEKGKESESPKGWVKI